jgi:hypothetical protein
LVFVDRGVPKKRTDEMMMATLFTTLHTPWETGLILDRVLKANCINIESCQGCRRSRRGYPALYLDTHFLFAAFNQAHLLPNI